MPLQSVAAPDVHGQIEIHPSFVPGLADLETFSHLYVIAHLHRGKPGGLTVVPFLDDTRRGVFATRSPRHPNPIGVSVVRLLAVRGATLEIAGAGPARRNARAGRQAVRPRLRRRGGRAHRLAGAGRPSRVRGQSRRAL